MSWQRGNQSFIFMGRGEVTHRERGEGWDGDGLLHADLGWSERQLVCHPAADSAVVMEIDHEKKTVWEEVIALQ